MKEQRGASRIHLNQPIEASLSQTAVKLVDLSTSGARINHDAPLPFNREKRFVLEFELDGERIALNCQVVRSRMERSRERGLFYSSGLRFVDLNLETIDSLWGLLAMLAIEVLQEQGGSDGLTGDLPLDFNVVSH